MQPLCLVMDDSAYHPASLQTSDPYENEWLAASDRILGLASESKSETIPFADTSAHEKPGEVGFHSCTDVDSTCFITTPFLEYTPEQLTLIHNRSNDLYTHIACIALGEDDTNCRIRAEISPCGDEPHVFRPIQPRHVPRLFVPDKPRRSPAPFASFAYCLENA